MCNYCDGSKIRIYSFMFKGEFGHSISHFGISKNCKAAYPKYHKFKYCPMCGEKIEVV